MDNEKILNLTAAQEQAIFWKVQKELWKQDIIEHSDRALTDEEIERAIEWLVNDYDCNMSHWNNIETALEVA